MASDLKTEIQLARSNFNQYRMRILLYTFPTAQGESIDLYAFFWFTFEEKLWGKELESDIPSITTKTLTSFINRGSKELAGICHFVKAATTTTRKDEEIHQYQARVERNVEKGNLFWLSFAPEVNDHLEVCRFLSQSDEKSVEEFAKNFQSANFGHWDEKLRVWALAEIYNKAFPKKFPAWIVGMAIQSDNIRFLAYLLAYTKRQGGEFLRNLQDEYNTMWGITLEFDVPGWESEF